MRPKQELSFITLLLLISFASVNAVLFTPALPDIAYFFAVSDDVAQDTITWFLIAYAIGQLLYGPIANRFGRKSALYLGVGLQIISSLLCAFSGNIHSFSLLIVGRFLLALGSGAGLKMTFTLVNECYTPKVASQKIAYLMLGFAVTPGLGVALGGVLNEYFGWQSCFYAGAVYGLGLLFLITKLPETQKVLDLNALKIKHLIQEYITQFKNNQLIAGGFLMGSCASFVYLFGAAAPFIAINLLGMTSSEYGIANILPPIGIILGSLWSARLTKKVPLQIIIRKGIFIIGAGTLFMFIAVAMHGAALFSLFLPMIIIYFGTSLIIANASSLAMSQATDKAHASAVMSFINMGTATLLVLGLGFFPVTTIILPIIYIMLNIMMIIIYKKIF